MKKIETLVLLAVLILAINCLSTAQAVDSDGDGISDTNDNCQGIVNPDQTDSDLDCPDRPFSTDPLCGNACDGYCQKKLFGDANYDCKVDMLDFAIMSRYWLVDCIIDPNDPACMSLSIDNDNDGWNSSLDCDDADPLEFPGQIWYADWDGDTYGDPLVSNACERMLTSDVLDDTDCDDADPDNYPGNTEVCDGQDNDCDSLTDEYCGDLCSECTFDEYCGVLPGGKCTLLDDGYYCTQECGAEGYCPAAYSCTDVMGNMQCLPDTNSCVCTSETIDMMQLCENTNAYGTCTGTQTCTSVGWTACNAAIPEAEICDGQDNDCDGSTDEGC